MQMNLAFGGVGNIPVPGIVGLARMERKRKKSASRVAGNTMELNIN